MANIISSRTKEDNKKNKSIKKAERELGTDGLKDLDDEFNMNLYGEFVPTFNSWVLMDDQRERIKEITEDSENLWKNNK